MLFTTTKTKFSQKLNRLKKILTIFMLFPSVEAAPEVTAYNNPVAGLANGSSRAERNSSCSPQPGLEPRIYLTTRRAGLKAYSLDTSSVATILNHTGFTEGPIAYDSLNDKIYYGSWSLITGRGVRDSILRANADGSDVKAVNTLGSSYGRLMAVSFDWITGNLYGLTLRGSVFVCKEVETTGLLCCMGLVKHEGLFQQIVLSPVQGTMYWTNTDSRMNNASIWRAEMDGSNPRVIIQGPYYPQSLAIDFVESRLYWCGVTTLKIQSSNLEGGDVRTIFQDSTLIARLFHFRIAVHKDRIYWRNWRAGTDLELLRTIRSSTKTGLDIYIVHNSTDAIDYLAIGPPELPCHSRPNHCKNSNCSTICVLTQTSSRCLPSPPVVSTYSEPDYSCSLL